MSRIRGMRGHLASSIAVTCAAALSLPLALSSNATATPSVAPSAAERRTTGNATPGGTTPGSTQSLPLTPLAPNTPRTPPSSSPSSPSSGDRTLPPPVLASAQGLARRDVRRFSLVGVVWDDPDSELHGRVQVRTRATGTTTWSAWQDVDTHNHEHAADPGTAERASGRVRGSTAPLWVGDSDGVEVRVQGEADGRTGADGRAVTAEPLPKGLHVELVDPGAEPPPQGPEVNAPPPGVLTAESAAAASAVNAELAPIGATEIPALSQKETRADLLETRGEELDPTDTTDAAGAADTVAASANQRAKPYIGARPRIVTRRGWGADEGLRESNFSYTKTVKAVFVHHSASGNNYRCAQAPSVIRSIYRYHVKSSGWRDIGYNFLVDKCGNIYEGRAGGVAKPVMGAHTLGFNSKSMGIAVLGSFGKANPPAASVKAVAKLTAWKLGLYGANPRGKTYLKSGGGNLYRKGKNVRLNVISGHRDGFATECPGGRLYAKLGKARATSARYQGR
ncbi:peptidoglycan recognition protein [Streptomyces sp. LRE541]|uniref:peptidoglycan recognition protein family protein n=1 Tax=Streptomyces sp. LRE541 TaxID=2931983 RepID=UPI00200F823E|nr:peptidoglycan recognition protein [Streptomyces sp. LRE541]UPZ30839.1 peptidoglycan recognition protein [Streptomyces sp. LRE541]